MLNKLRNKIDKIDIEIVKSLVQRHQIVKKIAKVKKSNAIPIEDLSREKSSLENLLRNPNLTDSQTKYIEKIFQAIYAASKDIQ